MLSQLKLLMNRTQWGIQEGAGDTPLLVMQFTAKILPNNRVVFTFLEVEPLCKILDPPPNVW